MAAHKKNEVRDQFLTFRLTVAERKKLEAEAKKAKVGLRVLVRTKAGLAA